MVNHTGYADAWRAFQPLLVLLLFALALCPAAVAQDRPVPAEIAQYQRLLDEGDGYLQAERFAEALAVFESLVSHADEHESLEQQLPLALARVAESCVGVGSSAKAKGLAALDRMVEIDERFGEDERVIAWRRALEAMADPEPPRPPGPSAEEVAANAQADELVRMAREMTTPAQIEAALVRVEQALRAVPSHAGATALREELDRRKIDRDARVQLLLSLAREEGESRATKDAALQKIERALELHPQLTEAAELRDAINARYTGAVFRPGQTQDVRVDNLNIVIEKAWIPPGVFTMGIPPHRVIPQQSEFQEHLVRISSGFWMMTTEVQQGQFEAVMGYNPSRFQNGPSYPVERVNWFEAVEFANKLTDAVSRANPGMNLKPHYELRNVQRDDAGRITSADVRRIPGNRGYRLPTEAEWEYACRAGTRTAYAWGDDSNDPIARFWANGPDQSLKQISQTVDAADWDDGFPYTAPVGPNRAMNRQNPEIRANAWGLYEMHGNVAEWCWDWFGSDFYQPGKWPTNREGERLNPTGPSTGTNRVFRGGSYLGPIVYLLGLDVRSSLRPSSASTSAHRWGIIGFRLTLDSE